MDAVKQVPATALTANDTTSQEELGQERIESDGKTYRYVRMQALTAVKGESNNYTRTVSHTLATFYLS